jgi:EF-P beta-lysylation protein EpmB|tara:strand:+ start:32 stop:1081 length:1050 start_codon:yes stop_codon:yes gene_type:complete
MITLNHTPWHPSDWQSELKHAFRQPEALLEYLDIANVAANGIDLQPDFALLVPRGYAQRIEQGNIQDPLLRQVLSLQSENEQTPGFVMDPLQEGNAELGYGQTPGLLHKYQGRVLMITTPACAINCRYCFRRHFPYTDHKPKDQHLALEAIAKDTSIHEVILSGGDPLLMNDDGMAALIQDLDALAHVKRIRIHTRLPIVLPQRVTADLVATLEDARCKITMVIHSNHPNELDETTERALTCLRRAGITLLNQSVLLKGINSDAQTLINLSELLFDQGVLPYYLHMPDKVAGTAHFYLDDSEAQPIYEAMREQLPGYLLPRLVRELPGGIAKTPVNFEQRQPLNFQTNI